jgi:DNA end-binding protein Ku
VLVLQSLLWPDEVREASFPALEESVRISAQEREMSAALVESMAADFEPEHFTDDYQVQLRKLIEAKLEKGDSLDTEETFGAEAGEGGKGEVIDLMEALKRSLDRKRGGGAAAASRDDESDSDEADAEEEAKAPAKAGSRTATKSAAAKSTASRSTATKSTATKSAAGTKTAAKSTASKSTAGKPAAKSESAAAKSTAAKSSTTRARKGA